MNTSRGDTWSQEVSKTGVSQLPSTYIGLVTGTYLQVLYLQVLTYRYLHTGTYLQLLTYNN